MELIYELTRCCSQSCMSTDVDTKLDHLNQMWKLVLQLCCDQIIYINIFIIGI